MGLFGKSKKRFIPDFTIPEHENWLNYLNYGGTSQEWERLKRTNKWIFPESETERFEKYQKEVSAISQAYFKRMNEIQKSWSAISSGGDYTGELAHKLEKICLLNVAEYEKISIIDKKYDQKTPTNIPALKRLAMLYEKQGRFEEAIEICKKACSFGMDECSRMTRMIKKAGRTPTLEEEKLLLQYSLRG